MTGTVERNGTSELRIAEQHGRRTAQPQNGNGRTATAERQLRTALTQNGDYPQNSERRRTAFSVSRSRRDPPMRFVASTYMGGTATASAVPQNHSLVKQRCPKWRDGDRALFCGARRFAGCRRFASRPFAVAVQRLLGSAAVLFCDVQLQLQSLRTPAPA